MAENKGYIYLERKLQDSAIWASDEKFDRRSAWVDLLFMMNHEDKEVLIGNKLRMIRRGQRWTSIKFLAERWGWSREKVGSYLGTLESAGMITTTRTNSGTLINVVNYSVYQQKKKPLPTAEPTANRHQTDIESTSNLAQTSNDISNDKGMKKKKGIEALGRILQ